MAGETKHSGTWSSLCSLSQPKLPPTPPETTFKDQTVLITGGNSGLGYETARRCLILQARRVIITVRSKAKGQDAISRLQNDSSVHKTNPMALIEAYELDLDDYQSTILFVNKVKHELTELDVLLCNAGINVFEHQMSKSGHERHLQVNCFSHFLIIMELLPLLQATVVIRKAPSRLTIVGSYSQKRHTLEPVLSAGASVIDYLDGPSNFDKYKQYPNTKVLVNAFIKHLATIVPTDEVIMNVLCPGVVDTNIFRNFPVLLSVFMFIWRKTFARSVEEGGRASVYAMRVAGKESHGQFLSHNEITSEVSMLEGKKGEEVACRVWVEMSAEISRVKSDVQLPS